MAELRPPADQCNTVLWTPSSITLEVELAHQRRWATRDEAERDLFAYIEGYYNRERIHSALGDVTPEQAEWNASYPRVYEIRGRSPKDAAEGWTERGARRRVP